ncbi:leucine-rich repeat extensin-like protein 3 [Ziziphus jujuba]|uniref:Leucine-rich repeat extensin-like protein 3 n=1 Tax=Ziziphus jujuba TaxID=326968 RepID=A0A6P4AK83_ZIZJJ|nr:leucine-rich repeat extensin-like protein 3 [Ziziphus jujuba]
MQGFKVPMVVNLFVVLIAIASTPINGLDSRKLDEVPAPGGEKCAPCTQYPPPSPSPPPPSPPPPPASPPPSPPSPKKPPTQYCPPPPSSFLYITGPPGNLYPVDGDFNGATKKNLVMGLPFLVGFGLLLGLVAF